MLYEKARMTILEFETEDIVKTSLIGGDNNDYQDPENPGGDNTGTGGVW